jgi:hypothetical protein
MPELIMVASWRVITVSSADLMRPKEMSALSADFFSLNSMIFRPWERSCAVTASREAPLSWPLDGTPAPSTAL